MDQAGQQSQQFQKDFINSVHTEVAADKTEKTAKDKKTKRSLKIALYSFGVILAIAIGISLFYGINNKLNSETSLLNCKGNASSLKVEYTEGEIVSMNLVALPISEEDQKTAAKIYGVSATIEKLKTWFEDSVSGGSCEIK